MALAAVVERTHVLDRVHPVRHGPQQRIGVVGVDVLVDGEDLIILRESDVLGIIEAKAKAKRKAA